MASIPNNIVAKDSGGNIKKVDLAEMLQNYVRNDDIQNILSANWPACIKAANLSFVGMDDAEVGLESPYVVNAINLYTIGYDSSSPFYSRQFPVEQRFIVKSTDAYRFSIVENGVQFGVATNRKCFLVLSLEGYESFGSNTTVDEAECREFGTHGGNPIVLDWSNVVLGEGGNFKFSFKDPAKPIGIFGELKLSSRIENVGNIHRYNIELNFVICGSTAWANLNEANRLVLTTTNTASETTQSSVDLSSLSYPQIHSIGVDGQETYKSLSKTSPSRITFKEGDAISIQVSDADEGNVAFDEKTVSIAMDMESIVGAGLAYENGKLTAPTFVPANGADGATGGLVPSASSDQFNNVLTASGWRTLEEIGLNSALRPFVGASSEQDGEEGIVPQPLMADSELFLKGDGTWSGAVTDIAGALNCQNAPLPKEISFGIGFCNSAGEWMCPTIQCSVDINHDGMKEGSIRLDIPTNDIHGVSLCSPWSTNIPISLGDNINNWIANKTIWKDSKEEHFFAVFSDGCAVEVWLAEPDSPESQYATVNYRGYGPNYVTQRSITFLFQGAETIRSFSFSSNTESHIDVADAANTKIWPFYHKDCIRYEEVSSNYASEIDSNPEYEQDLPDLPWGGRKWINLERTAMLSVERLVYNDGSSSAYSVSTRVAYSEHPEGTPTLVSDMNPSGTFWDIKTVDEIEYAGESIAANDIVGHVWIEDDTLKAASRLFANWSVQATLEETTDSDSSTDESISNSQTWVALSETPKLLPGLMLEVSMNGNQIVFHSPKIDVAGWPQRMEHLDLILDYGLAAERVQLECLSNWINTRLEAHDKEILELERGLLLTSRTFSGATAIINGYPGLVPEATPDDRERVLKGDGTWGVIYTEPFSGSSDGNGSTGLVPAPMDGDADKYLRGDGTWASPTANINPITQISLNEVLGEPQRTGEVDLSASSILQDINALLASNLNGAIYVAADGTVSSDVPSGTAFAIQCREVSGQQEVFIQEVADGEVVSSSIFAVNEGTSLGGLVGQSNELAVTTYKDPSTGEISIQEVNIYNVERVATVSGLRLDYANAITGTPSSSVLDILYKGASSTKNAVPGLVPAASISEKDWFLRGDGTWQRIDLYQGATTSADGVEGLVPPASSGQRGMFLRGDATWQEIATYDAYQGATEENPGVSGLVPAATSEQRGLFLAGDGTWKKIVNDVYQGATEDSDGTPGFVPSATSEQRELFLAGDGTWKEVATYQGATEDVPGKSGLVPSATSTEKDLFLAGDGTWKEVETNTSPYQGATEDSDGVPGLVPSATSQQYRMFLRADGTWQAIEPYQGATEDDFGIAGLVPSANPTQRGFYLSGDGTWKEVPLYQGATEEAAGVAGLVPPATIEERASYLSGDGTWKRIGIYQGATENAAGITGTVPPAQPEQRKLYLSGDGTWASPVREFDAVSGISPIETKTQKVRGAEYDFSAALEQANAYLQEDSSREVYISIPDLSVGLEMPEGDGLMVHIVDNDEGQPSIEIATIKDGEAVNSTIQAISDLQDNENGGLLFSWNDDNAEIQASVAFDAENGSTLSINSLTKWDLSWVTTVSGLTVESTNTVSGEKEASTINLGFVGATETVAGRAGLAPQPMAGDQGKYLRGDGTWAELVLPNTYQGATENAAGVVGLVPAASSGERDKFLRGDGTWASTKIEGSCVCSYVNVKKQWTLGVNICDGDGSWLASAVQVPASIRPNEILTYTLNLRFGADGPGGCAIWNPYNATQPTSAEERTYEFYRDATIWGRDASSHFIQTFSDGITMNCWIEVDETQDGYHNLKISVYGPKATSIPRLIPLNVDGANMFLTETLAAGESKDIAVEGTEIKIYQRPTYRTVLWRNEISEWSGNASSEPVLVEETEAEFPYLSYKVQRTETGIRISADDYSLADWPVELAAATLELSAGGEQTTIDLGCIPAWVSNELQKIDEAIEQAATAINRIGLYKGATENENGVAGLVPPASSAERNGTLHGDGTWGSDIVVTNEMPTNSDAGNLFFYIED